MSFNAIGEFLIHEGRGVLVIAEGAIIAAGFAVYNAYLYFGGRAGLGADAPSEKPKPKRRQKKKK